MYFSRDQNNTRQTRSCVLLLKDSKRQGEQRPPPGLPAELHIGVTAETQRAVPSCEDNGQRTGHGDEPQIVKHLPFMTDSEFSSKTYYLFCLQAFPTLISLNSVPWDANPSEQG